MTKKFIHENETNKRRIKKESVEKGKISIRISWFSSKAEKNERFLFSQESIRKKTNWKHKQTLNTHLVYEFLKVKIEVKWIYVDVLLISAEYILIGLIES